MTSNYSIDIQKYGFNLRMFNDIQNNHYAKNQWPIVYILSDSILNKAYVGETTYTIERMSTHLRDNEKKILTIVHLITSGSFNKSATLDIESNLIKYMSADAKYELLNGNLGLTNHDYYQKPIYWEIFRAVWNKLRSEGISGKSIEYIDNSDLFKYSPYKSLTKDQKDAISIIIKILLNDEYKNIIIEGGAGTGKTVLATFLFKLLNTRNKDLQLKENGDDENELQKLAKELKEKFPSPKMALVVPMASFRNTLKKVFSNVNGLNKNMVIGPAEIVKDDYDIVLVDESHRLRRRVNLGPYFHKFDKTCKTLELDKEKNSELDWILMKSAKTIFFYDENQSIKPSDTKKLEFDKLKRNNQTKTITINSQFRVKGGNDYIRFIDDLLNCRLNSNLSAVNFKDYDFLLFNSIEDIITEIKQRNDELGLSRLVAGYSWEWISKTNNSLYDIEIENKKLQWNSQSDDWINSKNSINEVGCIHTTQGYDLNYTGVIFGNEITYDKATKEINILQKNYHDKNGKNTIRNPQELKDFILNIYKTLMLRGIRGTYIYVCDNNLREYFANHISKFKAEKSLGLMPIEQVDPYINSIPLYDLKAAAGSFSDHQIITENKSDYEWIKLPPPYKPSKELFACRVEGNSMNKIIPDGSICLFRKYTGGSREGKIVLVEHSNIQDPDIGSCYTVKEYHSRKINDGNSWKHISITLKPLSYEEYNNIILDEDELNLLRTIGIFECVLS